MAGNRVSYTFFASDKFSAVARKIAASTEVVRGKMRGLEAQLKRIDKSASVSLGRKLRGVSLAAGVAAGASLKAFGDLEAGVLNVTTLLEDDAAVAKYRGQIRGMIEDTVLEGFSIEDASSAVFDNVKALGAGEKSFKAFSAAQILARSTNTEIGTAVRGVSSILKAYGLETTDATKVTDAFVIAQRKGIKVEDMAEAIAKVAPLAAQAGIGFEELFATTAQLASKGMAPGDAVNATKAAIVALIKPGKTAEKMFRALGVPVGVAEIKSAGLAATLGKLAVVGQKYPDIMDQLIPNVRALTAAASLGAPELAAIKKTMGEMGAGGAALGALAKQESSFNDALGDTLGSVRILGSMIGEGLAPVLRVVGFLLRGMVSGLRALGPIAGPILAGIIGIAAAAAPVLIFFGKFLAVAKLIGVGIAAAFSWPVLAIVALAAAVGAAVYFVVKNFDAIAAKAAALKNAVAGFLGFGSGSVDVGIKGAADQIRSQTDINVLLSAPKGAVQSVKTSTSGDTSGLNLGVNMAGAF